MRHSVIYLVGFMGSGKTSVGRRLAGLLGWSFVDLDDEIEKRAGTRIRDLFRIHGEEHFRRLERQELERMCEISQAVVALGGGAFCSDENQELIARYGVTVWLDSPLDLSTARCGDDDSRPLAGSPEEMANLLERRRPFYARAMLRVGTADRPVDDVAREIIQRLEAMDFLG
jgi:shikimate kinase